jgi:23S rRNA (adenine1618-N6)-methyltransferase
MLPPQTELQIVYRGALPDQLGSSITKLVSSLGVQWQWNDVLCQGVLKATKNVWSRSARRRALQKQSTHTKYDAKVEAESEANERTVSSVPDDLEIDAVGDQSADIALVVKLTSNRKGHVNLRWIYGRDYVLFESFGGWLKSQSVFRETTH